MNSKNAANAYGKTFSFVKICDRIVLFAGDGDFYDSLNLIKNILRKDLWVVGATALDETYQMACAAC